MKIITVGGQVYLGEIKYDDNAVIVSNAMPVGNDVTRADLAKYLMNENAGKLEKDIKITGTTVFSERELSDDHADDLATLQKQFEKAKKIAIPNIINEEFARLI